MFTFFSYYISSELVQTDNTRSSLKPVFFCPTLGVMNDKEMKFEDVKVPSQFFVYLVVYYESIKRDLKRRLIYEYRCDERLF